MKVCNMAFWWSTILLVVCTCVCQYLCFKTKISQEIFSLYQNNLEDMSEYVFHVKPPKSQVVTNDPF